MLSPPMTNVDQHLKAIEEKLSVSDVIGAAQACARALELEPNDIRLLDIGGDCALKLWDNASAIKCYRRALRLNPECYRYAFGLGLALCRAERYQEAVGALAKAATLQPDSKEAHCYLGQSHLRLEHFQEALSHLEHGQAEQHPDFFMDMIQALAKTGALTRARHLVLKHLTPARHDDGTREGLIHQLSEIAYQAAGAGDFALLREVVLDLKEYGQTKQAGTILHFLIEVAPNEVENAVMLACFLADQERPAEGRAVLHEFTEKVAATDAAGRLIEAFAYCHAPAVAVAMLGQWLDTGPVRVARINAIAGALMKWGDANQGAEPYRLALSRHPDAADVRIAFGRFLHARGEHRHAIDELRFALATLLEQSHPNREQLKELSDQFAKLDCFDDALRTAGADPSISHLMARIVPVIAESGNAGQASRLLFELHAAAGGDRILETAVLELVADAVALPPQQSDPQATVVEASPFLLKALDNVKAGQAIGAAFYDQRYDLYRLGWDAPLRRLLDRICKTDPDEYFRCFGRSPPRLTERPTPSILFVTMYKSGTDYISSKVSDALGLPVVRIMTIDAPTEIIPSWLDHFSTRGGLCVHHLPATPETLGQLRAKNISRVWVSLRDPRQSFLSAFHFEEKLVNDGSAEGRMLSTGMPAGYSGMTLEERLESRCRGELGKYFGHWAARWIEAAEDAQTGQSIHFSTYEQMLADEDAFFRSFAEYFGFDDESADRLIAASGSRFHFRRGLADEWKSVLTAEQADYIISAIPDKWRKTFGWN